MFCKVKNPIKDAQHKISKFLCENYDAILLHDFNSCSDWQLERFLLQKLQQNVELLAILMKFWLYSNLRSKSGQTVIKTFCSKLSKHHYSVTIQLGFVFHLISIMIKSQFDRWFKSWCWLFVNNSLLNDIFEWRKHALLCYLAKVSFEDIFTLWFLWKSGIVSSLYHSRLVSIITNMDIYTTNIKYDYSFYHIILEIHTLEAIYLLLL